MQDGQAAAALCPCFDYFTPPAVPIDMGHDLSLSISILLELWD
jgi:hypothetical protein